MKSIIGCILLLSCLFAACESTTVKDAAGETVQPLAAAKGEVRSMVGEWRANLDQERGVWIFEANGSCIIRSDGLREQKGTYVYNGKTLTLHLDNGTVEYEVLENREPSIKLFTSWQGKYDITIPLKRIS